MPAVCLYFKIHEPSRLRLAKAESGYSPNRYENVEANLQVLNKLADDCYLPSNKIILQQILESKGKFRVNFSISGIMLELLCEYRPDVVASFRSLIGTGAVEIVSETYYHSLSSLYSPSEFRRQVLAHRQLVKEVFAVEPIIFRNTELIHNNNIARIISDMGMLGILCEGSERLLSGKTVNRLYKAPQCNIPLLLRNSRLSDDIAFRFNDPNWQEYPLTARKFSEWIHNHPQDEEVINLFLDYETFGLYKAADTGIFDFLSQLPHEMQRKEGFRFSTAAEVITEVSPSEVYNVPKTISWDDKSAECCVVCENMLQNNMLRKIYSLERVVHMSKDKQLLSLWGVLQTADYFYYMTDIRCRNNEYSYLNPFGSPAEAHRIYAAIVTDFEVALIQKGIADFHHSHYDAPAGMLY